MRTGSTVEHLPLRTQEDVVADDIVEYSHQALRTSRFFTALAAEQISMGQFTYVLGQYRLLRDRFHTWFGLCIFKSGSCDDDNVRAAVLALAEHIAIEMRDGHDRLFRQFLIDIGLSEPAMRAMARGEATRRYDDSFFERFGLEGETFFDAVSALSAREIFHSIRNEYVLTHFLKARGFGDSEWWTLHVELELDHFKAAVQPVLRRGDGKAAVAALISIVKREIDRHVQYWDELLEEAEAAGAC
jgi:hypothetical protein